MKRLYLLLSCIWLAPPLQTQAQNYAPDRQQIIEACLELVAETSEEEEPDLVAIYELLSHFYRYPIDLNRADARSLHEFPLFNALQTEALLAHIERYGKLISLLELQVIPHFNPAFIRTILPFVRLQTIPNDPQLSIPGMIREGRHEWISRYSQVLEPQAGYQPSATSSSAPYPGSPYRLFTRYRFRYENHLSWGITAEKDPGEAFFKGSQKQGFDFYSAHLMLRNRGKLRCLILGDYHIAAGQGLTFSSSLDPRSKSAQSLAVKRTGPLIRPHTSAEENRFLRGIAATFGYRKTEITFFASHKKQDARLEFDANKPAADLPFISSLPLTGIHATSSQLETRKTLPLSHYGVHTAFHNRRFRLALTQVYSHWAGVLPSGDALYNRFDLNGTHQLVQGIDYSYVYRNFHFFGETSLSLQQKTAFLNGVIVSPDPGFSLCILHRRYDPAYRSFYTRAFGEYDHASNEEGLYIGMEWMIRPHWSLSAYADGFQSRWLRYRIPAPSQGNDLLAQLHWKPHKKTNMYLRIRQRQKQISDPENNQAIPALVNQQQTSIRGELACQVNAYLTLRSRIETTRFRQGRLPPEKGWLLYQDLIFKSLKSPLSCTFRYAIFETDSYNSRIYAYENDVLYLFSIPAYYRRGTRFYSLLKYRINRHFDIWLRYGRWIYEQVHETGSGLNRIEGSSKTEISIQVRWSL